MKRALSSGLVLLLAVTLSGSATPDAAEAVLATQQRALKAVEEQDVETWLTVFSEEALVLPPGSSIIRGKPAVRREIAIPMMADSNLEESIRNIRVEVSQAGDLAYQVGTYELTFTNSTGQVQREQGKYVHVWKKQPDGSWQVVADIWNTNRPPEDVFEGGER